MKKTITKSITCVILAFISGIIVLTTGCGGDKSKIQKDTPFAFIPYEYKVIGKINIASILKIEDVSKHINNLPYVKEVKAGGLNFNDMESAAFGIEINSLQKGNVPASPSNGVLIISAKSKINVADYINTAEKNNEKIKFKTTKIEGKTAYILPAAGNDIEKYIIQLNDKLVAIGTPEGAAKAVDLINNKGKSILDDTQIMRLSKNTGMPDMLWIAAVIHHEVIANANRNVPNITDCVISVNYLNNSLKISGLLKCVTIEDAQKILMPLKMASSFIAMNSKNAVKPEDISLKADGAALSVKINLTKEALSMLISQNNKQYSPEITAPIEKKEINKE